MKWVLAESDPSAAARLSDETGIHPLIAILLVNRGVVDPQAARSFLSSGLDGLSDPGIFTGMERAVGRIRKAIAAREKIIIYGDYDVDGVTGAALLYLILKDIGAEIGCYIPDRMKEGYGLNPDALERIRAEGAALVITVDCGINAFREAAHAGSLGLDLIITDHHELQHADPKHKAPASPESGMPPTAALDGGLHPESGFDLPSALSILHPVLVSHDVPDRARENVAVLTGVGVAFKLAQALLECRADDKRLSKHLDLVTLGTVADLGRITGENRILVKHGLGALSAEDNNQRKGISALKQAAGLNGKRITAATVGFALAPRINASGRLESADAAFRLLTTESQEEAVEMARALDAVNRERQEVEERILEEARTMCRRMDMASASAIVLASKDWHPGVIGIVASRIAEEFYRPTALISLRDGVGKGSARSIPGFDLYAGLAECSDILQGFGGHMYAAGLNVSEERVPELRERLNNVARERVGADGFVKKLSVDAAVALSELTPGLVMEIEKLSPFGQGNPEPRLGARRLEALSPKVVGNKHLKLRLRHESGATLNAIAFKKGGLLGSVVREGAKFAAVFTPRLNTWNGTTSVELDIRDIKRDN